ncbi:unnamed protein product [Closterium sp. NIES-54]
MNLQNPTQCPYQLTLPAPLFLPLLCFLPLFSPFPLHLRTHLFLSLLLTTHLGPPPGHSPWPLPRAPPPGPSPWPLSLAPPPGPSPRTCPADHKPCANLTLSCPRSRLHRMCLPVMHTLRDPTHLFLPNPTVHPSPLPLPTHLSRRERIFPITASGVLLCSLVSRASASFPRTRIPCPSSSLVLCPRTCLPCTSLNPTHPPARHKSSSSLPRCPARSSPSPVPPCM